MQNKSYFSELLQLWYEEDFLKSAIFWGQSWLYIKAPYLN